MSFIKPLDQRLLLPSNPQLLTSHATKPSPVLGIQNFPPKKRANDSLVKAPKFVHELNKLNNNYLNVERRTIDRKQELQKQKRQIEVQFGKIQIAANVTPEEQKQILKALSQNLSKLQAQKVKRVIITHADVYGEKWQMSGLSQLSEKIVLSSKLSSGQKQELIKRLGNLENIGKTFASNLKEGESVCVLGCKGNETNGYIFVKKNGKIEIEALNLSEAKELAGGIKLGEKKSYKVTPEDIESIKNPPNGKTAAQIINEIREKNPDAMIDLEGANLRGMALDNTDLSGANLRRTDFRIKERSRNRTNLSGANLMCADLTEADLRDAKLTGADLQGANLSGANLEGADLTWADLSGANLEGADLTWIEVLPEKMPQNIESFIDINQPRQVLKFFKYVLEAEEFRHDAYKKIFSNFSPDDLNKAFTTLFNDYINSENPQEGALATIETLFRELQRDSDGKPLLGEDGIPLKLYPSVQKALSEINGKQNRCLIGEIIQKNGSLRRKSLSVLKNLSCLPNSARQKHLRHLSNSSPEHRIQLYEQFNMIFQIIGNNQELASKYLDPNKDFISQKLDKIIQSKQDDISFLAETITRNTKNLSFDQYKQINNILELGENTSLNEKNFKKRVNALLNQNKDKLQADQLKQIISQLDLKPTDTQRDNLFTSHFEEIIKSSFQSALQNSINSYTFLSSDLKELVLKRIGKKPESFPRILTMLNYLKHSQKYNPEAIKHVYPIIQPYLEQDKLSPEEIKEIDAKLMSNFDQRFKSNYKISWTEKMKSLHPNFDGSKIRDGFVFNWNGLGFEALSGIETIFNGENVTSSQCTSEPGEWNGHLQLGLVGTGNMAWIQVKNSTGQIVSGFYLRVALDGGVILGPTYRYNNSPPIAKGFEQEFTNEYLKHIGIKNKAKLSNSFDPDISNLDGVKSYQESGETYYEL